MTHWKKSSPNCSEACRKEHAIKVNIKLDKKQKKKMMIVKSRLANHA